jgi:hypothetical protein
VTIIRRGEFDYLRASASRQAKPNS